MNVTGQMSSHCIKYFNWKACLYTSKNNYNKYGKMLKIHLVEKLSLLCQTSVKGLPPNTVKRPPCK